jgi:hypothetical protein
MRSFGRFAPLLKACVSSSVHPLTFHRKYIQRRPQSESRMYPSIPLAAPLMRDVRRLQIGGTQIRLKNLDRPKS